MDELMTVTSNDPITFSQRASAMNLNSIGIDTFLTTTDRGRPRRTLSWMSNFLLLARTSLSHCKHICYVILTFLQLKTCSYGFWTACGVIDNIIPIGAIISSRQGPKVPGSRRSLPANAVSSRAAHSWASSKVAGSTRGSPRGVNEIG